MEGMEGEGMDGKRREDKVEGRRKGKGRGGSTWIFVQGSRVPIVEMMCCYINICILCVQWNAKLC